jgi:hypothetical protein
MRSSKEYEVWVSMVKRCSNPKSASWPRYGGRGIRVCEQWRRFEAFFADMGPRPPGAIIDRIDVNGNYEPANCRWATPKQSARNKTNTRWLVIKGEAISLPEASERFGIRSDVIWWRLRRGWSPEDAIGPDQKRKLTAEQVRYIRASAKTEPELAKELLVTRSAINAVRARRTWKHV